MREISQTYARKLALRKFTAHSEWKPQKWYFVYLGGFPIWWKNIILRKRERCIKRYTPDIKYWKNNGFIWQSFHGLSENCNVLKNSQKVYTWFATPCIKNKLFSMSLRNLQYLREKKLEKCWHYTLKSFFIWSLSFLRRNSFNSHFSLKAV